MNVALVIPNSDRILTHRVRGSGVYAENLSKSLKKYFPKDNFIETTWDKVPSKADIVHFLYFEPFFLTLPIFKKGKIVVTVHDFIPFVFPKYFPRGIRGEIKWLIQKNLLKRCDAIITDSESSKKDIIKFTGIDSSKVKVVYLAVDRDFRKLTDKEAEKTKLKYKLPEDFLLYVGDVTWNKNLPRLIEAVGKLNIPLVLVGKALASDNFDKNNPWNRDLSTVKDKVKGNKKIKVLGFVDKEDLVGLYNLAKVFVMPSLYEGFGFPILEAMACGCPVVTSKTGSIPEVTENSVYYVNPCSTEDISKGILKVYSEEKLQKDLSQKGLIQAKIFSWEKTASETMSLYKKLLKV